MHEPACGERGAGPEKIFDSAPATLTAGLSMVGILEIKQVINPSPGNGRDFIL